MAIGIQILVQKMIENPLKEKLRHHKIILASGSPRRKKFFEDLGLDFEIRLKAVKEIYPEALKAGDIASFLAELKATAFDGTLNTNEILVTSDTVVWYKNVSLAKASTEKEAIQMLKQLSGDWHEVITAVCFTTATEQQTIIDTTRVKFAALSQQEMKFYINQFQPFDKAGAYGIQEWIGAIAIEKIEGSYNNVVGLPTHLVYKTLMTMVD